MSNNLIGDRGAGSLATALRHNRVLRTFYIIKNRLTPRATLEIAAAWAGRSQDIGSERQGRAGDAIGAASGPYAPQKALMTALGDTSSGVGTPSHI